MYIRSVSISHFRNLSSVSLEFSEGFNVFYGDNAQGKSNLLEAIYTLAFLKGFRADRLLDMVEFGASSAALSVDVFDSGRETRLGLEVDGRTRHAFVDGAPCRRVKDYLGILRAILFVPSDVGFLQNAPAVRRNMLDKMVFNLYPAYLIDMEQYQKLIKEKSALLRTEQPDEVLLDTYDAQILPVGERILRRRFQYLRLLSPHIANVFGKIFDESLECRIGYKSSVMRDEIVFGGDQEMGEDDLVKAWRSSLASSRSREMARQQVVSGPHRDDWSLFLNGRHARYYASQGQQRSMSLALKLAEIECLKREAGVEPVFLLDDVSSELDPVRHKKLFEHLNSLTAQTFLTTTAKSHIHIESVGKVFHVSGGSIDNEGR